MNKIANNDKKHINKVRIAKFILKQEETSKAEIASSLEISMPTVLQNIKELIEENIVVEVGKYGSTGGRKAKVLSISENNKYSIGIDITSSHISYVMISLKGNIICKNKIRKDFENSFDYNEIIHEELTKFIKMSNVSEDKILGVGISMPGVMDRENEYLIKSHILKMDSVSLKNLSQLLEYKVCYENDANSAAMAELRYSSKNAVYLSLSNTVGGSIYIKDSIYIGDNYRSAEFGHMIIQPNGEACYCGKHGCADVYCSAKVLAKHTDNDLEEFFERLSRKDEEVLKVWDNYLEYLAIIITNLRMAFDCDIIVGGYVGGYLNNYISDLNKKIIKYNKFENDTTYLKICRYKNEASAIGIARYFIEDYFETL